MSQPETPTNRQVRIKVKYEELSSLFASQVVVNATQDEIFLDFSSGALPEPGTGDTILPIHTRIAMTYQGASRLLGVLQQTLSRATTAAATPAAPSRASLPRIDQPET